MYMISPRPSLFGGRMGMPAPPLRQDGTAKNGTMPVPSPPSPEKCERFMNGLAFGKHFLYINSRKDSEIFHKMIVEMGTYSNIFSLNM